MIRKDNRMPLEKGQSNDIAHSSQQRDMNTGLTIFEEAHNNILSKYQTYRHIIHHMGGHRCGISDVEFTLDDQFVVTGSHDGTAKLWDVDTGKPLITFMGHKSNIHCVAVTPDGNRVITGSGDHTVKLWKTFTGECTETIDTGKMDYMCLTPDGHYLLTTHSDPTPSILLPHTGRIKRWSMATNECIQTIEVSDFWEEDIVASPDGKYFLTGGNSKVARLWHFESGECLVKYESHEDFITSVCFSSDNSRILTCSRDGVAKIWDVRTSRCVKDIKLSRDGVLQYSSPRAIFADGNRSIIVYDRGEVNLINVHSGKCIECLGTLGSSARRISVSHNSSHLALSGALLNVESKTIQVLAGEEWSLNDYSITPDKKYILTLQVKNLEEPVFKKWELKTGRLVKQCNVKREAQATFFARSAFNSNYLVLVENESIDIYDIDSAERIHDFSRDSQFISLGLIPFSNHLVVSSKNTVKIFDIDQRSFIMECADEYAIINEVCVTPSGEQLLIRGHLNSTNHAKPTTTLFHLSTGRSQPLEIWTDDNDCHFTPDGNYIIYRSNEGISIEALSGDDKRVHLIPPRKESYGSKGYWDGCLSPDRKYVIATGSDGVHLWNFQEQKFIKRFTEEEEDSPRIIGGVLLTRRDYHLIHFRSIPDGKLLGRLHLVDTGFLWTVPEDGKGEDDESSPYFWTDRKDLITVYEQSKGGSDVRILKPGEQRFEEYFQAHNRQDIVMARINNSAKYDQLVRQVNAASSHFLLRQHSSSIASNSRRILPGTNND